MCHYNLKQIGAALLAYEEDWGSLPPTIKETYDLLFAYLRTDSVLICPSQTTLVVGGRKREVYGYYYATYIYLPDGSGRKKWQIPICVSPIHLRGTPEEPIVVCYQHDNQVLVCDEGLDVPSAVRGKPWSLDVTAV